MFIRIMGFFLLLLCPSFLLLGYFFYQRRKVLAYSSEVNLRMAQLGLNKNASKVQWLPVGVGAGIRYTLVRKVDTPISFCVFAPRRSLRPISRLSYMPYEGVIKLGEDLQVNTDNSEFLAWVTSGGINKDLYLLFSTPMFVSRWNYSFVGILKTGMVAGKFHWPKGYQAVFMEMPASIVEEPHLSARYVDTFVRLIDTVGEWYTQNRGINTKR